ncbi:DHHC palmitoyltransferase-like protein 2 [Elsinoe fawcettii]|nr:DHHC palmitoyltransferase-like protein 2 [Elsinoe fawcettii]
MELLHKIAIGVGLLSFFTFVVLFGRLPGLRKTPIGWLQVLLIDYLPRVFSNVDQTITGGRTVRVLLRLRDYLFFTRNPIIMVIFLFILTAAAYMFLSATYNSLTMAQTLPIPILLPLPYIFTFLCATSTSHFITSSNHAQNLTYYPYDHVLYHPTQTCSTCQLPKPARSKHCSLCNRCVSRCDHHCPWVNACLGRTNYRYFLYLLLSLPVLEIYGAYLGYTVLSPHLNFAPLHGKPFFSSTFWNTLARICMVATNTGGLSIAGVTILAATTAPLPLALLSYHIYLIWAGTTTNENAKWGYLQEDMDDGLVWRGKRSEVVALRRALKRQTDGPKEQCKDWPVDSDQIIVRTRDGLAPRGLEEVYEQVWSLRAVDNIYDLGFWDNLVYVLQGR